MFFVQPLGDVDEVRKMIKARTLHICPFPFDEDMYTLEEFFRSKVPLNSISMLKKRESFSGEIFLECKTLDAAKEASAHVNSDTHQTLYCFVSAVALWAWEHIRHCMTIHIASCLINRSMAFTAHYLDPSLPSLQC